MATRGILLNLISQIQSLLCSKPSHGSCLTQRNSPSPPRGPQGDMWPAIGPSGHPHPLPFSFPPYFTPATGCLCSHLRAFALADPVPGKPLSTCILLFYLHPSLTLCINIYSSVSDYSWNATYFIYLVYCLPSPLECILHEGIFFFHLCSMTQTLTDTQNMLNK